jgi:hypothetical protein
MAGYGKSEGMGSKMGMKMKATAPKAEPMKKMAPKAGAAKKACPCCGGMHGMKKGK